MSVFGSKTFEHFVKRIATAMQTIFSHPVYLKVPLISTSWDGDAKSDVSTPTQLDLSAVFGAPAGIQAVSLQTVIRDSGGAGTYYFYAGPSSTYAYATQVFCFGSDYYASKTELVPCDANGDIWYTINASGAGTMDVWLRIWGYVL